MKLLLYCTKAKPSLMKYETIDGYYTDTDTVLDKRALLNGKIVAECDYDVEEIKVGEGGNNLITETLSDHNLLKKSCLSLKDIVKYTENIDNFGYAIHIKNLHIFDKPRELKTYLLNKAPQNMCYGFYNDWENENEVYAVISIRPQWLCKILNGEKTIEIRKKVLKEMIK